MSYITPKTNWVDGEYFNIDPDYNRIKGNIEYLHTLSETMYVAYEIPSLAYVTDYDYPTVDFFNNVVKATQAIIDHIYKNKDIQPMRLYKANGSAWDARDLNIIERNHSLIYSTLIEQREGLKFLPTRLGGVRFGK